jgi:hypothetical protein
MAPVDARLTKARSVFRGEVRTHRATVDALESPSPRGR